MTQPTDIQDDRTSRDTAPIRAAAADTLDWGFRASAAILALGLIVTLVQDHEIEEKATSFTNLLPDLIDGQGSAIVSLAILAMMVTPVVAVIIIALGFSRINDSRYARISLIVLGVLAISIVASFFR